MNDPIAPGDEPLGGPSDLAQTVLPRLSEAGKLFYVEAVERVARERQAQQRHNFNVVDFLMGAAVILNESGGMGDVPASWIFSIMSGHDPLTGERVDELKDAEDNLRQALDCVSNADKQMDMANVGSYRGTGRTVLRDNAKGAINSLLAAIHQVRTRKG